MSPRAIGRLLALTLATACSDTLPTSSKPTPAGPADPPFAVGVSNPTPAAAQPTAEEAPTYVFLAPGTVPGGQWARIENQRTGATAEAAMLDGGFDPVSLPARAGDTLLVTLSTDADQTSRLMRAVPPRRPPIIVRTAPTRGGTDVPLNAYLRVVFSEPVTTTSISTRTIHLLAGGVEVPGRVQLSADGLNAWFYPAAPLAPSASYVLRIETAITDLDGDRLESASAVDFQTGNSGSGAGLTILPNPMRVARLSDVDVGRVPLFSVGTVGRLVQWSVSDTTILTFFGGPVSGYGWIFPLTGWATGSATVTATLGTSVDSTTFMVEDVPWTAVSKPFNEGLCLLSTEGLAYCKGNNDLGELGLGATGLFSNLPVALTGGPTFDAISRGHSHVCALTPLGEVYCWGDNRSAQVGDATLASHRNAPTRVASGGIAFSRIAAGGNASCALTVGGSPYCWGGFYSMGWAGSLGVLPTPVPGSPALVELTVGSGHACGLDASDNAYCWGDNYFGQLGDGTTTRAVSPVAVAGGLTFASIAADAAGTCAVTRAGEAYCWGGAPPQPQSSVPARVDLPTGVSLDEISLGNLACGRTTAGEAYCWGWTIYPPNGGYEAYLPPQRVGSSTYVTLSAGSWKSCGITGSGGLECWQPSDMTPSP